jgi:hypothetical protein
MPTQQELQPTKENLLQAKQRKQACYREFKELQRSNPAVARNVTNLVDWVQSLDFAMRNLVDALRKP